MKIKLSPAQSSALHVLKNGGRIFSFDDGTVGLDDADGNTLSFSRSIFTVLLKNEWIEVWERPSIGCEVYALSSHFEI